MRLTIILSLFLLLVAACSGSIDTAPTAEALPLVKGKPNFLFFYTDN